MSIMALPCPLHAVFMMHFVYKGHAHKIWIHHDFNCHMNKREKPETCLTNHKGSTSHPVTPLGINSLRARTHIQKHTHTHTHKHTHKHAQTQKHTHTHTDITITRNQSGVDLWLLR